MLPIYYNMLQVKMFNEFSYTNISSVEFDLCFKYLKCIIYIYKSHIIFHNYSNYNNIIDLNNMKLIDA